MRLKKSPKIKRKKTRKRYRRKSGLLSGGLRVYLRRYNLYFKHLFIVFIVFSVGYVVYQVVFVSEFFTVQNIYLEGDFHYVCRKDFEQMANSSALDQNIFKLSPTKLEEGLKKSFLAGKEVTVQRKLPHSLYIHVAERSPIAVVKQDLEYLVDVDGFVLGIADNTFSSLPRLGYEGEVLVGQFLGKNTIPLSMQLLEVARLEDVSVSSISFSERYSTVHLDSGVAILLNLNEKLRESFGVALKLVKKLSLEGETVSKVDLRYDKVVVSD